MNEILKQVLTNRKMRSKIAIKKVATGVPVGEVW